MLLPRCHAVGQRVEAGNVLNDFGAASRRETANSAAPEDHLELDCAGSRMQVMSYKVLPDPGTGERYGAKGRKVWLPKSLEAR
jgi:hypothetical protein